MNELHFYPTVQFDADDEDDILKNAGYEPGPYSFYYRDHNDMREELNVRKGIPSLVSKDNAWDIIHDGLWLEKSVRFNYPQRLQGPDGIICRKAVLGACIIWTNSSLKQMGYILPKRVIPDKSELQFYFEHFFAPGSIANDLSLKMILYVQKPAPKEMVEDDERFLMNECGVSLGTIDEYELSFKDNHAVFPVKQIKNKDKPLWYLELGDWEDPDEDMFSEENLCLYLNTYYKSCPTFENFKDSPELLIDIISTSYFMLFQKVDNEHLSRIINSNSSDQPFEPGSISEALSYLYRAMDAEDKESFDSKRLELQMIAIQNIIRKLLLRSLSNGSSKM